MDNTIEEIDLTKRCYRCGNISLKCAFCKDIFKKDELNLICRFCRIGYYNGKDEQKIKYQEFYAKPNRAKINLHEKKRKKQFYTLN